nr:phosphotransferase [Egibacter rhizosphaerae]
MARTHDLARGHALVREASLLTYLSGRLGIAIPVPVLVDAGRGVLVCRRIAGRSLLGMGVNDPLAVAAPLADALSKLHATPITLASEMAAPDPYPLPTWRDDAADTYRSIAGELPIDARRALEAFLASPTPHEPTAIALCHNDLGAEHLLVDPQDGRLTGIIDWSDAALTDPCRDFARLFRDFGPRVLERILGEYSCELGVGSRDRIAFYARCTLIEDLAFGFEAGDRRYRDAAIAHLEHTFRRHP